MKISVKLDKRKSGETADGFPIVVYVTQNYNKKAIRTGYYSKDAHWNKSLSEPKKAHPDFYIVSDYLENLKTNIKQLILRDAKERINIADVPDILFKKNHVKFYDAAMDFLGPDDKTSKYSAVVSFNTYYPAVTFSEVTVKMVQVYIEKMIAKGNKPGGVDSYVRSLRSLWNKLTVDDNPFSGYKIAIPEKVNTIATAEDINALKNAQLAYTGVIGSAGRYRDYFLLMFYLGGIDPEVLVKLRYDVHVVDGRIQFNRDKGGSMVACSNKIPDAAHEILKKYNCKWRNVGIWKRST